MKNIYLKCNNFYKIATLVSDVANRIIFPLTSRESFDFIAGRIVAKGAVDLLYYGIQTVIDELQHYQGNDRALERIDKPSGKPTKLNIDTYISSLELATKIFLDLKNWRQSYGGKAWARISDTLFEIANWYKKYMDAEKYSDDEEQAIRRLTIYMNKFDGLAHNTGTIYNKLVQKELNFVGDTGGGYYKNLKTIEKLRDISESENVGDIIREVSPYLNMELPFKDYLSKIRRTEEYWERDPKRIEKHIQNVKKNKKLKNMEVTPEIIYPDREREKIECYNCEHPIRRGESKNWVDGNVYCEQCVSDIFTICANCGEYTPSDNAQTGPDDDSYCNYCFSSNFKFCWKCDRISEIKQMEKTHCDPHYFCDECSEALEECKSCGGLEENDNIKTVYTLNDPKFSDLQYCATCLEKLVEKFNIHQCEKCENWVDYKMIKGTCLACRPEYYTKQLKLPYTEDNKKVNKIVENLI